MDKSIKNILVTGGAGFIGSHLVDFLISKGHKVTALDNFYLGKLENIAHLEKHPKFSFVKLDLLDKDGVSELFAKNNFDMVYHLAANSDIGKGSNDRIIDLNLNLMTTLSILEAMVAYKVKKIMFASTSAIYGAPQHPVQEDSGPLRPVSFYGASKLAAEAYISSYVSMFDLQAWICRFPNVVGERATHGIIFDFMNKLKNNHNELNVLGDGSQYKPYIYVGTLVRHICRFIDISNEPLNIINLGAEDSIYVRDIAEIVVEKMGLSSIIHYGKENIGWKGDVPTYSYDLSKMKKFGFETETSRQAVEKSLDAILSTKK